MGGTCERPREKLERAGVSLLGDNELLALVLGSGTARANALEVANALLASAGGVHGLVRVTTDELCLVPGIGAARASRVIAAVELGRRTLTRLPGDRPRVSSPRDAAALLMPVYGGRATEQFGVVLLDTRHRVVRTIVVSSGTVDASFVHPREVFRHAAAASAAAIVLFHNHPSGDPSPSRDDLDLTRRMRAAGELMGIEVLDHIIIGEGRYCSLQETGRL